MISNPDAAAAFLFALLHNQGLQNTVLPNRGRKFRNAALYEVLAGLLCACVDIVHVDKKYAGSRGSRIAHALALAVRLLLPDQRAKTFTKGHRIHSEYTLTIHLHRDDREALLPAYGMRARPATLAHDGISASLQLRTRRGGRSARPPSL